MIKKPTGKTYHPAEFRKLNECLACGEALMIPKNGICEKCKIDEVGKCEMCDVLLRKGKYIFFTYDIKEDHRGEGVEFKASKECVREFTYEETFEQQDNENICNRCSGWESRIKNRCWSCETSFDNTKENYKKNGNLCKNCGLTYLIK